MLMGTYVILLFLCTGITLTLATRIWRRRAVRGGMAIFLLLMCVAMASFFYAMKLSAPTLAQKPFWNRMEYLGGADDTPLLRVVALLGSAALLSLAIIRYRLLSDGPIDADERNQLLLNHAHVIFYTIDTAGHMTYVSPNWTKFLGHEPAEVMTRSFTEFVIPEDHALCYAFLENVIRTGMLQTGAEYRVRHKEGHIVWHTTSIIPVRDKKGKPLAYVGAAHDITGLKDPQQALTADNERLSELIANREAEWRYAIADVLTAEARADCRIGEAIHDGLCQELVGLARLAETAEFPDNAGCKACRRTLDSIRDEASRLAGVARDFSHDLTLHELDIQTLPEALETLARRTDQLFQTETELNVPATLEPLDHEQNLHIYRIIREAVANAVKHARAKRLWIDLVREPRQLVVSISNDGLSLPETTSLANGLGLKQMRTRTRLLDGQFSIRRNKQHLTVVELIIPLAGKTA